MPPTQWITFSSESGVISEKGERREGKGGKQVLGTSGGRVYRIKEFVGVLHVVLAPFSLIPSPPVPWEYLACGGSD